MVGMHNPSLLLSTWIDSCIYWFSHSSCQTCHLPPSCKPCPVWWGHGGQTTPPSQSSPGRSLWRKQGARSTPWSQKTSSSLSPRLSMPTGR